MSDLFEGKGLKSVKPLASTRLRLGLCIGLLVALFPGMALAKAPRPGSLDRSFSRDGIALRGFGLEPGRGVPGGIALQADGKAVVLLQARGFEIVRLNVDGSLDGTFGDGGYVVGDFGAPEQGIATDIAVQPDGRIVVAGEVYLRGQPARIGVARYTASGQLDRGFGSDGNLVIEGDPPFLHGNVEALLIQPDGKLIVAGLIAWDPETGLEAVRLMPDGRLDRSFGGDGFAFVGMPHSDVSAQLRAIDVEGGKLTAAVPERGHILLVRLGADGSLDRSFGGGIVESTLLSGANGLAVQPDGRTIVSSHGWVARYLANGSPDPGFGEGGLSRPAELNRSNETTVSLQPDGRIVLAGSVREESSATPRDLLLARLTPSGSLDSTLGGGGFVTVDVGGGTHDYGHDLALSSDGRMVLLGEAVPAGAWLFATVGVVRYLPEGGLDSGFGTGGIVNFKPQVASRDVAADVLTDRRGRMTATGRAGDRIAILRYLRGGRPDPDFGEGGLVTARVTEAPYGDRGESIARYRDGRLLVGSGSGQGGALLRFLPDGTPDPRFGTGGVVHTDSLDHIVDLAVRGNGRIVALGLASGSCEVVLAGFNPGGGPDPKFGKHDGVVSVASIAGPCRVPTAALAFQRAGRIVVAGRGTGDFLKQYSADGQRIARFGRFGRTGIARFLPDRVNTLTTDRAGRVLVGGMTKHRFALTRFSPNGRIDRGFARGGSAQIGIGKAAEITALQAQANGGIVAGGVSRINCYFRYCATNRLVVASYGADGRLDRGFGRRGVWLRRVGGSSEVSALALGKRSIAIAGWAAASAEGRQLLLAKLHR